MTLTKIIHDVETNEITEVALDSNEIKEIEKLQKEQAKLMAIIDAEIAANAIAKSAILDRLGLTADEAKLLLS